MENITPQNPAENNSVNKPENVNNTNNIQPQTPIQNSPSSTPEISDDVMANLPPEVQAKLRAQTQNIDQNSPQSSENIQQKNVTQSQENNAPTNKNAENAKVLHKKKKKKRGFPVLGCFVGFIFLYLLSIGLGIMLLWFNKDNTAFLGTFGLINDSELKDFILSAIQFSFMPLALLFLILTIVGVFTLTTAKKDQPEKKRRGIVMMTSNLIALIVLIPIWITIYNFVFNLPVAGQRAVVAEIIIDPADTRELVAPTAITLSSQNIETVLARNNIQVQSRSWDFDGDGNFEVTVNESEFSREFQTSGTFNIAVRIVGNDNREYIYSKAIVIPEAVFEAEPNSGQAPLTVTFNARTVSAGSNIQQYRWDFDQDNIFEETTSNPEITFTFDKIGNYTIRLQTIDTNGIQKNYSRDIEVLKGSDIQTEAVIETTPGTSGTVPFQVQFDASNSVSPQANIQRYEWNFGDGSPVRSGEKQNYVFKNAGTFPVTLTLTDTEGNKTTSTQEITVRNPAFEPSAVIRTKPEFNVNSKILNGTVPFTVQFDGSLSTDRDDNIKDYQWDFDGDDTFDEFGDKVEYIFRESGTYTVTLKVIDTDNQESSQFITVNVNELETKAVITATPESGPVPLTVQFDATSSTTTDGSDIVNYEWDFGDGGGVIPTGAITSHRFDKVGSYLVRLKIFSSSGLEAETTKTIFARVVPLQSCFKATRTSGPAPLATSFDSSCSTGTIKSWKWSFGDGFISDDRKPSHTFQNPGNYTVRLEVTDARNTVSVYEQVISVE